MPKAIGARESSWEMDYATPGPKTALVKKVFSFHTLEAAKAHSIALVNSVDLYCIVCGVLSGQIKTQDLEHMREKILHTNGLSSCCSGLQGAPFHGFLTRKSI